MPFNAASICVKSAGLLRTVGFAQDQALFGGRQIFFAKFPHRHRLAAIEAFVCWIFATCQFAESSESKSARPPRLLPLHAGRSSCDGAPSGHCDSRRSRCVFRSGE